MAKITCTYCNTLNDAAEKTCIGCGAPLEITIPQQAYPPQPTAQPFQPKPPAQTAQTTYPSDSSEVQEIPDGVQQIEKVYTGATNALGTALNITSDAIAIAMVAFALGLVGGATGMGFWGVLGAMLAGLVIGYTEQSFWMNVIAPSAGALIGIAVGGIAWAVGVGPKGMVFTATGLASLGALIGARRRITPSGCGAVVRPLLGAASGFLFALLGLTFGLAIHAILS